MIGEVFSVSSGCASYSVDLHPHNVPIKNMANKKVVVISSDGNGSIESQAYLVENEEGERAWCWKRELIKWER